MAVRSARLRRVLFLVAVATLGAGILLAPLGLLATVAAFRRVDQPAGVTFWIGAGLNALLTFTVVVGVVFVAATS